MTQTFLLSVLLASLFLNLAMFLSRLTGRALKVNQGMPAEALKLKESAFSEVLELIVRAELWEVVLPAFLYSFIYSFLPFSGFRAGLFLGLIIFALGALPQMISLDNTLKLPLTFFLHQLLWRLIKIILIFGTFGYFFN